MDVPLHEVRDLSQQHWADAMHRLGGGRVANPYQTDFFTWCQRQIVSIDGYPYAGIDFRGDSDMPLPPGLAYGDIGNESQPSLFFKFFDLLNFLYFLDFMEAKRHVFVRQHIVTSTIYVQMWDHGGQKASLIIDEGERILHLGCGCGANDPEHSYQLCEINT